MTILIGTNNRHKATEMQAILQSIFDQELTLLLPSDVGNFPGEIEETGTTLEENAYIKAATIFEATGIPCMSDDTGLEVDALHGQPGVYSARYAGADADFASNRAKLLRALHDVPEKRRTAQFRTVICFKDHFRTLFAEGICPGRISEEEHGRQGFGYDPVFQAEGESRTFAELSAEEKNTISHRGKALQAMATLLADYLKKE